MQRVIHFASHFLKLEILIAICLSHLTLLSSKARKTFMLGVSYIFTYILRTILQANFKHIRCFRLVNPYLPFSFFYENIMPLGVSYQFLFTSSLVTLSTQLFSVTVCSHIDDRHGFLMEWLQKLAKINVACSQNELNLIQPILFVLFNYNMLLNTLIVIFFRIITSFKHSDRLHNVWNKQTINNESRCVLQTKRYKYRHVYIF